MPWQGTSETPTLDAASVTSLSEPGYSSSAYSEHQCSCTDLPGHPQAFHSGCRKRNTAERACPPCCKRGGRGCGEDNPARGGTNSPETPHQLMQAANLIQGLNARAMADSTSAHYRGPNWRWWKVGVPPRIRHLSEFTSTPRHRQLSSSEETFSGERLSLGCWSE